MSGYEARRFGPMLLDSVRVDTYRAALGRLVGPTTTVLDVGCGTGVFTLAALEFGAAHVTAIDNNPVVDLLPTVIRANGYADRCTIYRGDVTELTDQRFDLVVSDLRGTLPLYRDHLQVIASVLDHNLSPGGVLLPASDRLVVGLVSRPRWHEQQRRPWQLGQHDLSAYDDQVIRTPARLSELPLDSLATATAGWAEIDYGSASDLRRTTFEATVSLESTATGAVDGVAVWFETTVHDDLGFDTGPSDRRPTYGRLLLPMPEPVDCTSGTAIEVTVAAHRVGDDYAWRWRVHPEGQPAVEASSFESMALGVAATGSGRAVGTSGALEQLDRGRAALDARILALLANGTDRDEVEAELIETLAADRSIEDRHGEHDDGHEIRSLAKRHLTELIHRYRTADPIRLL